MIARDAVTLALRAVTAQPLRSALTLGGIAVGIAAVIVLTSIGEGIQRYVLGEFSQFGTNVVSIAPGRVKVGGGPPTGLPTSVRPLTLEDALALERLPHVVAVAPTAWGNAEVTAAGRSRRAVVYGAGAAADHVFRLKVRVGRFLPAGDEYQARSVVVLGPTLARELFGAGSPLGARLRIGEQPFLVIGVLESRGQFIGMDLDDTAFVPAARALELFNRPGLSDINLSYREGADVDAVVAAVRKTLAARHGREDFTVTTQQEMLSALSNILAILTMAVAALGSISLLVGAVGIVTIMTIAVTERTGEIGLMVALGAQRRTILALFLGEAVVLAVLGGLAGLAAGLGLAQLLHAAVPALPVSVPAGYAVAAVASSALIGLAAGVLPAHRASRLDPVQALRAE
jgi:putative ABC transport system permease protein